MTVQFKPPKLASVLLRLLPNDVKDDISGDLQEECREFAASGQDPKELANWYWRQSIMSCWSYMMTRERVLKTTGMALTLGVVAVLMKAVLFISNADYDPIWDQSYWTNGAVHKLFFEPFFWQMDGVNHFLNTSIGLWVNVPSLVWAVVGLSVLVGLKKRQGLSSGHYALVSLAMVALPYAFGVLYFNFTSLALNQSGPVIAFMWLSIIYLAVPAVWMANHYKAAPANL